MKIAHHGRMAIILPRRETPANKAGIFIQKCHFSKSTSPHTAELTDVNVMGERGSYMKHFVATEILQKGRGRVRFSTN